MSVYFRRCLVPINELSPPNINPQPINRNPNEETANTIKFLERIFTVFFDLANPASTAANPKFIKKTRIPARNTHNVSIIIVVFIYSLLLIMQKKRGQKRV